MTPKYPAPSGNSSGRELAALGRFAISGADRGALRSLSEVQQQQAQVVAHERESRRFARLSVVRRRDSNPHPRIMIPLRAAPRLGKALESTTSRAVRIREKTRFRGRFGLFGAILGPVPAVHDPVFSGSLRRRHQLRVASVPARSGSSGAAQAVLERMTLDARRHSQALARKTAARKAP
jgi:hypothetical protein